MSDVDRLPPDKTYRELLLPYLLPYVAYTSVGMLPASLVSPELAQVIKLVATSVALAFGRRHYRFGSLSARHLVIAVACTPIALLLWVLPFWGMHTLAGPSAVSPVDSLAYFGLRMFNSVILVALFEELLMRVYVVQCADQAAQVPDKPFLDALQDTLDARPLASVPVGRAGLIAGTVFFTLGHAPVEYVSAVCYFLFTLWLYRRTGSLWVCIIIHALTNLAVGLLVRLAGIDFLWF